MAKVSVEGDFVEVEDGGPIKEACKALGIPFSCEDGVCGTCRVDVLSRAENLTEFTEPETNMGIDSKNQRLACQCKIKQGEVSLKSAY